MSLGQEGLVVGYNWDGLDTAYRARAPVCMATSGSTAKTKVSITRPTDGCDCSQGPWCMVLVTAPEPNGAVGKSSGVWKCFCIWDSG